jgi:hypothetical protein
VDVEGVDGGGELVGGPGADDGRGHAGAAQEPGHGDVGGGLAELVAQVLVGLDGVAVPGEFFQAPAAVGGHGGAGQGGAHGVVAFLSEDAAEQPGVQWRPRHHADAVVGARGQHFQFGDAFEQVVDGLLADEPGAAATGGGLLTGGDVPRRMVGGPHVDDFALGLEDVHRLPDLLPRDRTVDVVHLVDVDVVGAEAAQRRLARLPDVQRRQASAVGPLGHPAVELGGEDGALAAPASLGQPSADDLLGQAFAEPPAVHVGRVDHVDAELVRPIHDREGVLLGRLGAEVVGAEHHAADRQSAAAEVCELHVGLLTACALIPK